MYLYEKNKDKIDVYELKARRDKLFEFKRRKMEEECIDSRVYKLQSNNKDDLIYLCDFANYTKDFINKRNYIFKHKNGIKLSNIIHSWDNGLIIDGLLYRLFRGDYDIFYKTIKIDNNTQKYLLLTDSAIVEEKTKFFDAESYKYSIDKVISIPESIYLLKKIIEQDYSQIVDKNIDEQLALYDFIDTPIQKLDLDTIRFVNQNYLTDNDLEVNNCILKKVRQINK